MNDCLIFKKCKINIVEDNKMFDIKNILNSVQKSASDLAESTTKIVVDSVDATSKAVTETVSSTVSFIDNKK